MASWLEWILYILLVIVMLGVLIAIHEAGHLAMAKTFNVYCFEYSIGMGPKLFSRKRKNGETYFSLRAIPFGGFVSMYGEPGVVPEGVEEPAPERSLENIKKWKKAIILVAGVTLNFVLGLMLIYIGNAACPIFYSGYSGVVDESGIAQTVYQKASFDAEILSYIDAKKPAESEYNPTEYGLIAPVYHTTMTEAGQTFEASYQILAYDVHIFTPSGTLLNETSYVAIYSPTTLIDPHSLGSSIKLYPASTSEVPESLKKYGVTAVPQLLTSDNKDNSFDFTKSADGVYINIPVLMLPSRLAKDASAYAGALIRGEDSNLFRLSVKDGKLDTGVATIDVVRYWNTFQEGWESWAKEVPQACTAIVKGFASLFTPDGWKNMSSIVGITAIMPQINAQGGAHLVFYFAGMISINLAFFNLLPFPGLDGWQLLVTAIEGISKKKVPQKVQGIVSLVGMVLLFGLMAVIVIKDIIGLF